MDVNMKTKTEEFEVLIPSLEGNGMAERVKIPVTVEWDEEVKEWLLTLEAHEEIENTKARLIGLLSPAQMKELRERFDYSQREMGELFQVGEKSWTRWETGKQRPSRSMNLLIRALYDGEISINYLLKRAGKPSREVENPLQPAMGGWSRSLWAIDWHLFAKSGITIDDAERKKCVTARIVVRHSQSEKNGWASLLHATPARQPALKKQNRRYDYENVKLA
jgi:DNA-binding transcriptional regulator YiaG